MGSTSHRSAVPARQVLQDDLCVSSWPCRSCTRLREEEEEKRDNSSCFFETFFRGTDGFPMPLKAFPREIFEQDWSPRGSASCTPHNQPAKQNISWYIYINYVNGTL